MVLGGCKFTNKNWSISLLKAVALVEGLNAIELEWSGLNPPFEVEFDALEVYSSPRQG